MRLSIIIPAHNATRDLPYGLAALLPQLEGGDECLVVDDASSDETRSVATNVRIVDMPQRSGPAAARNSGAAEASGDILVFLDSDVVPHAGLLKKIRAHFAQDSELAAVLGSYDDRPASQTIVSRFRNLLHCYTHRTGKPEASTFWAGCGAIRKDVFHRFGGFDQNRFPFPSIEDIELGTRLRAAGKKIVLDAELQVQHRKHWTFWSMVQTDVLRRAAPWTVLILESRQVPQDLNLKLSQRASVAATGAAVTMLGLSFAWLPAGWIALALVLLVAAMNLPFYRFLAERGGWAFAIASMPLHWTYFLSSILGFIVGAIRYLASTLSREPAEKVRAKIRRYLRLD
jgi:glycosyltransferase involved in cell wall biosynthesis